MPFTLSPNMATTTADDGRWTTVYCSACGGHYPLGHGCQGGNGR